MNYISCNKIVVCLGLPLVYLSNIGHQLRRPKQVCRWRKYSALTLHQVEQFHCGAPVKYGLSGQYSRLNGGELEWRCAVGFQFKVSDEELPFVRPWIYY